MEHRDAEQQANRYQYLLTENKSTPLSQHNHDQDTQARSADVDMPSARPYLTADGRHRNSLIHTRQAPPRTQTQLGSATRKRETEDGVSFMVADRWLKKTKETPRPRRDPAKEAWRRAKHRSQEVRVLQPSRARPTTRGGADRDEGTRPAPVTRGRGDTTCKPSTKPSTRTGSTAAGREAPTETYEVDDDEDEELEQMEEEDSGLPFGPAEATELWRTLLEFEQASGTSSSSSTSQAFMPHYMVDNIQQAVENMGDEEIMLNITAR